MSSVEGKSPPPPSCLALVVCEAIWTDPATGKKCLLGCFDEITARHFPATHPAICTHMVLTNGRGRNSFRVVVVDVDEQREPIAEFEGEIEFPDVRALVIIEVQMPNLLFPTPGEYRVQMSVGNEFIVERSFAVVHKP